MEGSTAENCERKAVPSMANGIGPTKHHPLDAGLTTFRPEVRYYLRACENLIAGIEGAHEEFMVASVAMERKSGLYTVVELTVVQNMLHRVSEELGGNNQRQKRRRR